MSTSIKRLGLNASLMAETDAEELSKIAFCAVCLDFIEDPLKTDCPSQHVFCRPCVESLMFPHRCPSCDKFVSRLERPGLTMLNLLQNIRWKCSNTGRGCQFTGTKPELDKHLEKHCNAVRLGGATKRRREMARCREEESKSTRRCLGYLVPQPPNRLLKDHVTLTVITVEIPDFVSRAQGIKRKGQSIESAPFIFQLSPWTLQVFPQGNWNSQHGFASVFLSKKGTLGGSLTTIAYSTEVLNRSASSSSTCPKRERTDDFSEPSVASKGWPDFCPLPDLLLAATNGGGLEFKLCLSACPPRSKLQM
uniref:RING-type domain-containing protein n=1 Tax=Chromera velia CCMP2878 TaxID=1169474 RepID=A0A0G4H5G3_9ALVE|mmetsp:Transcript_42559/g.83906  ORF Transcript_42559/g.83906 Transcript_42559/m.83906 type:complete len:307 (+) Transcript_42559:364-1284(+)|eukprot:Cvel_5722.t1-p1 / transcript=Cvel_5722.t1 / gene=Cvel_5722 / organism=Chromera_velia_CCMP2878 / gene_product=hypothetical protein / transcript_product=hypothetical protein / location=Cvel_scaffold271:33109-35022(-) / protein_length=306 / sequence_SO=supercontig / SO=protein_coding / is_pseudo=false